MWAEDHKRSGCCLSDKIPALLGDAIPSDHLARASPSSSPVIANEALDYLKEMSPVQD